MYNTVEDYFHEWTKAKREEVQAMEKAMESDPRFEENEPEENGEEGIKKEMELMHLYWRKGLSKEEWKAYQSKLHEERSSIWKMFMEENSDYDYHYVLSLLKFKLEWVIFYWTNFGHLERAGHDVSRMRTAVRLLEIIMNEGLDRLGAESVPYVNKRNRRRFKVYHVSPGWYKFGKMQKLRFYKAYCLFFRFLEYHLLGWWD